MNKLQTILGAGGAIGSGLAAELVNYTRSIRLVSRNPVKVNQSDELIPADLTDAGAVDAAVEGSEIVYLTAGLKYRTRIWESSWPVIMRNVLDACIKHGSRLVFFDNVYMYDPDHLNAMTESCPVKPCSRKGAVRAHIAGMLMSEVERGKINAMIVRAADFLSVKNSVLVEVVYRNLIKGKKALWIGDADRIHSFTYDVDAAKATALLGNDADAYNQVWHLPTDRTPMTARNWIELMAREMRVKAGVSTLPVWSLGIFGLVMPEMGELKEMAYQYQNDYFFDSGKFENHYGARATGPQAAVRHLLERLSASAP